MKLLFINADQKKIIDTILVKHKIDGLVFGSRTTGRHQTFSDLDICVKQQEKLPIKTLANLTADFEESNLPFTVDIIDYHRVGQSFQKIIDATSFPWNESKIN